MRVALHWQILIAMFLGTIIGIVLNVGASSYSPGPPLELKNARFWSSDSPDRVLLSISENKEARRIVVGDKSDGDIRWPAHLPGSDETEPEFYPTLAVLQKSDPTAFKLFYHHGRSTARWIGDTAKLIGDLFLRMLKMVSVPLIIASLLSGVTGLGHADRLGKMFGRTLLYYVTTSMLAIMTGLLMVNFVRPGVGNLGPVAAKPQAAVAQEAQSLGEVLYEQLLNMIPTNPFASAANGDFLSIIAFTIFFGVCTILVGGTAADRINEFVEALFAVMMKLTTLIINLAPIGVFFLMLAVTATQGVGIFGTLGWYMLAVALALGVHALITLPLILRLVAKRSPWKYAQAMSPALLTAFSSASSNGTLPLTLTCVEERAKVSNRVGSFVLPLGATVNMDGTALYEVVAVLFIAQFNGLDLSMADQLIVAFTALLASIGAAGIPHAGLVMMAIILQAVGLPTEDQALIIAVDRVLDMARTAVNVWSDSCGCAVIARFESEGDATSQVPIEGELNI
ncbi:dicarboxylate/amino acid:cation symporter [Adhaeretor mobilis]|uniref:Proton glutamate symport protein n=1 Tax=Adhaeretor mobilis TaxID=1930276 RepID=A0A517MRI9_9BACT|nr:dicarboxylate/amino acid:cation symporter [Adhaeretor mobilis]QDS97501.1 Proton glutamate symport protein [Adhaeretor mobilis]